MGTMLLLVAMCVFMGAVVGYEYGRQRDVEQDAADDAEWVEFQAWLAEMRADTDVTVIYPPAASGRAA
jgi:hypothetical protein